MSLISTANKDYQLKFFLNQKCIHRITVIQKPKNKRKSLPRKRQTNLLVVRVEYAVVTAQEGHSQNPIVWSHEFRC